ncbi:vacuolar protein sorting-associated protein 33A-like [Sorex fumeus]|uniref:vacuolar protein sorting-associated protein 33A-like n=1 Tax=Sorex fumeus TaxID=62283 RepID=UPI0024AD9A55|nr:vacuolar protein sorting-associated protein 33A-like [Sorex fumeus]
MDIIAENVLSEDRHGSTRDFHILFVPRRNLLCEQRLKDLGVLGSFIHREEYSLDLIPFDGDLLSMESEGAFRECYLDSDQTGLYHATRGLMTLLRQGDMQDLPTEAKKLPLDSAEELYAEIRDRNFNAVGAVLSKKAKVILATFEDRDLPDPVW